MDFGTILDKWDKLRETDGIYDKDAQEPGINKSAEKHQKKVRQVKSDASIDLHGLSSDEAWIALESFFESSRKKGYKKVLIIHGKGNHRPSLSLSNVLPGPHNRTEFRNEEGAMRDLSRRFVESCSFAGKSGYSPAREGGTGATWVFLKEGDKTETTVPGR